MIRTCNGTMTACEGGPSAPAVLADGQRVHLCAACRKAAEILGMIR